MRGDLPASLVDGHIHWLNLSTSIIEIRPLKKLWEESSENWKIDCASGQYRMHRGCEILADVRSPTWAMVSKPLRNFYTCLGNPCKCYLKHHHKQSGRMGCQSEDLLITTQSTLVLWLSVTIPCYGLSFFINEREELESHDFKDMVYDEDQSIGALFGLENLLVLRPKTHPAGSFIPEAVIPRRVLIPNGHATRSGDHRVEIHSHPNPDRRYEIDESLYYVYNVDIELGCLTGEGSLKSARYLAHLHATTSCYRPDPLTGKTGAQGGLCLLQSAQCRSITKLKSLSDDIIYTHLSSADLSGSSINCPQINIAHDEIQQRYYWTNGKLRDIPNHFGVLAAGRASHLFPWNTTATTSTEHPDSTCLPEQSGLGLEDIVSITVSNTLPTLSHLVSPLRYTSSERAQWPITLEQLLFDRPAPGLLAPCHTSLPTSHKISSGDIPELNQLFSHPSLQIKRMDPPFKERYLTLLGTSAGVSKEFRMSHRVVEKETIDTLQEHYAQCRTNYMEALRILKKSLGPTTDREQALEQFGQWPPVAPGDLLQCLASTSTINLPVEWNKCITMFALCILDVQHSRRLLRFALDGLEEEFSKELENEGCGGCDAEKYPDWLLIQVLFWFPCTSL